MAEAKREVRTVMVEYICDECNKGKLRRTGRTYPMNPPSLEYRCDHCGEINNFRESYPAVRYEEM